MKSPFRLPRLFAGDSKAVSGPVAEVKATSMVASAFAMMSGDGAAHWSGRSYAALARAGFMKNSVAHRAVRMIAEAAATVPWLAYDGKVEVDDHAALPLLLRPNGRQGGVDFFEALYGHLLLAGNAYVEPIFVSGRLRELHLLRPDRVSVVEGRDGWPVAYDYRAGGVVRRLPVEIENNRVAVLHLKLFHPLEDHSGLSPLAAAGAALDLFNAATGWNKALLDNSARPSGALVYQPKDGGNLSPDQYDRLRDELEAGHTGAMNAGRPLILEGGLDWKAMALSPKDMDFIEAKNGAARDIALGLGVPPMLLGIPGDNTYANYQEAHRAFYRLTVLPMIFRTAASFSAWLGEAFGAPLRLEPDLDKVAGLSAEREALWARVGAAAFLSDDEKREAVGY